ncbi:hypothetical protein CVT25_014491 [Psilocybe cyanescens]|uniref:PH domain-containing protein n=1 Tax=Psilocybe cyanescens TaxID=93625 RepID=A0A409VP39_PSICY|nr:hypothetical protein CVT25_014491 [Psilocybe cyanescens]
MLGTRSIGAGTPGYGSSPSYPSRPGGANMSAAVTGADDPYDTLSTEGYGNALLTPAQRLIERYERLSTPSPPQTPPAERSTFRREYRTEDAYSGRQYTGPGSLMTPMNVESHRRNGVGTGLKKDRSPIRQSLKNLFSVLKKGAGGLTKRRSEDREPLLALGVVGAGAVGAGLLTRPSEDLGRGTNLKGHSKASPASTGSFSRPKKKMTGSLHYLIHSSSFSPDSGTQNKTWTPCSVTLEPETHKLLVSSFTTGSGSLPGEGMELYVHEIALSGCVNIRSLSATQLGAAEARLLLEEGGAQGEGDKMKVFEILFEDGGGRVREMFAARSVRERAGWISAIWYVFFFLKCFAVYHVLWDAILPSQEAKNFQTQTEQKQDAANDPPAYRLPVDDPIPKPLPQSSKPISPSYSDRSLPALPPKSPIPISDALPLSLPIIVPLATPKKVPNLRLDLSEFKGPISPPNMRPPAPQTHGQFSPNDAVISPSIYPPTSRPTSMFIGSPISPISGISVGSGSGTTSPYSPSIRHLSQLSVVRQRLAQIERNHSELSAESRYSSSSTTPSSGPVSPTGSGWSKREAIFHNAGAKAAAKKGTISRSSSRTGYSRLAHSSRQAPPPGPSNVFDDSGHDKEDGTPKAKCKARQDATADIPTKTVGCSSQDDILKISRDVADIRNVLGKETGNRNVHQIVIGLEQRAQGNKKDLRAIKDTLKVLGDRVAEVAETTKIKAMADTSSPAPTESKSTKKDDEAIVQALDEVRNRLRTELPALASKIQDIKDAQEREKERVITCANVGASSSSQVSIPPDDPSKVVDPKLLLDKLEEIRKLCQPPEQGSKDEKGKKADASFHENLTKILDLVQEDGNKQVLLAQQQADSVRYLNELNAWLEAFVNNGTSQIQGISANIDRLCNEIGAGPVKPGAPAARSNLVNDIRQLVEGMKARDQNFAALQAAVHSLLEVLTVSQTQKGADSQAIAGLMDRQRHAQEVMFRAFTNEISGEIKGERLRFVDAMKEATAINVQRVQQPLQTIQPNTGIPVRHSQETPRASIPRSSQYRALPNYPRPR